ncbi:unnamed protein product [Albugo candida]|uniref:Uncharacterized protein n=1 Tax=Albugo candida TaxID=65357 RepID=A0A024GR05_9STRA|nr:unnamed protein product [Albugo candida]|eukprot:CCI49222.1 unnamed protein product [Albugo candida]
MALKYPDGASFFESDDTKITHITWRHITYKHQVESRKWTSCVILYIHEQQSARKVRFVSDTVPVRMLFDARQTWIPHPLQIARISVVSLVCESLASLRDLFCRYWRNAILQSTFASEEK